MMHTAACHIRMPAYRHKTNTAMPISSAAEILTVKAHHLLSPLIPVAGLAWLSGRRSCGASCGAATGHGTGTSRTPRPSRRPVAPHAHTGRPLRHPVNLRPILITSCQRSLAFRKVRSAKNAASPDTIGSGKHRVSFRAAPPHSSGQRGCPPFIQLSCMALSGPARPAPYPVQNGPGFFMPHECAAT